MKRSWGNLFLHPLMVAAYVPLGISLYEILLTLWREVMGTQAWPSCASAVLLPVALVLALLAVWRWLRASPKPEAQGFAVVLRTPDPAGEPKAVESPRRQ